jgi:hypothetical protein
MATKRSDYIEIVAVSFYATERRGSRIESTARREAMQQPPSTYHA